MMRREIKFRAWDKRSEQMFENNYLVEAGRQLVIFAKRMRPNLPDMENAKGGLMLFTDDENMVFMQFTGLRDKNGLKEIYEGDIIDIDGNVRGNIYEAPDKRRIDLVIERMGTPTWRNTEQAAVARGCKYTS